MSTENSITFEHTCIACKKTFRTTRKYDRFCKICRIHLTKTQKNAYIRQNKPKKYVVCAYCGKEVLQKHKKQKFCSKECASLNQIRRFQEIPEDENSQLCWTCAHTNAIDCPWFELPPTLNPNCTAVETELGYHITACKDYEPDKRFILKRKENT